MRKCDAGRLLGRTRFELCVIWGRVGFVQSRLPKPGHRVRSHRSGSGVRVGGGEMGKAARGEGCYSYQYQSRFCGVIGAYLTSLRRPPPHPLISQDEAYKQWLTDVSD